MPVLPNNTDPLKDYVMPNMNPSLTQDGLVYNKIYPHTGVVDILSNTKKSAYNDPTVVINNPTSNILSLSKANQNNWISSPDFGGTGAPVVLQYVVANTTYFNFISLSVLNVPCFVELLDSAGAPLPGSSSFTVPGGADLYTKTNWLTLRYYSPTPNTISSTVGSNFIQVRITRQNPVEQKDPVTGLYRSVAYSVGVENFTMKLNINALSDVPTDVVSGTNTITSQNRFGFIEKYSYSSHPVASGFTNETANNLYWKSGPQPVQDSIVFFYAAVNNVVPTLINRIFIDPIYSGCSFNVYYTTDTDAVDPSQYTWTPIQRDFTLRKGIYEIPNILCTYLKFEFTKLIPEVYDLPFDSVTRTINVFPSDVEAYFTNLESTIINGNATNYSFINSNNNQNSSYAGNNAYSTLFGTSANALGQDNNSWPLVRALTENQVPGATTPSQSSSTYVIDPTISYKLLNPDGSYNNNSYSQFLQRRFPTASQHVYSSITLEHSWHVAYFTGVNFVTAFYENNTYDDLRAYPGSLIASNGTTSGFFSQNSNYVFLNPDDVALTPWFSTIDSFKSFNIGAMTTDWQSFLTDNQVLLNDTSNLKYSNVYYPPQTISILGKSTIINITPVASGAYSVNTGSYASTENLIDYLDANFFNGTTTWSGLGGTTLTSKQVNWVNGTTSGTASGIQASGGSYAAAYKFTLPGAITTSGLQAWQVQYGSTPFGTSAFAISGELTPSGTNYYFITSVQVSGDSSGVPQVNTNIILYTQFINPLTNTVISGTTVTGTNVAFVSGTGSNIVTATGSIFVAGVPSNTVQLVISGTNSPFSTYQLGAFTTPTTTWTSPQDIKNMRVSAVARMFLPITNNGTYRVSLYAYDANNNLVEISYKQYTQNTLPTNTWIDIEVQGYTGGNYNNFFAKVVQTDSAVQENFYLSMLAPFYHPVRYEYITQSGSNNWQPIVTGLNDAKTFISAASGIPASGIQVRMTALSPNVLICGVSIVPKYKQSSFYTDVDIDYFGSSKTNELSSRKTISKKPYFITGSDTMPSRFTIHNVIVNNIPYIRLS